MIVTDEVGRMPRGLLISFHSLLRESTDVNTEHQIAFGVACFLTPLPRILHIKQAVASVEYFRNCLKEAYVQKTLITIKYNLKVCNIILHRINFVIHVSRFSILHISYAKSVWPILRSDIPVVFIRLTVTYANSRHN